MSFPGLAGEMAPGIDGITAAIAPRSRPEIDTARSPQSGLRRAHLAIV
jgi:hypothetical protein